MTEKVKVSREVADFIESCKNNGVMYWEDDLLAQHSEAWVRGFGEVKPEAECMNTITPIELAKILVNGYEIERTPEENLLELYKHYEKTSDCRTEENIIEEVLEILGIKIKGINE